MLRMALFLAVLGTSPAMAQLEVEVDNVLLDIQPGERSVPEESRLAIYTLKHLPASDIAAVIGKAMAGEVSVISEPQSNRLLVRGSGAKLREAKALLELLDQPARMIAFDIVFADLPAKAEEAKSENGQTSDEAWLARLKAEQKNPKSKGNISKVRLTALDNQLTSVQYGVETAVVTGVQFDPRRAAGRTAISRQRQTGTLISCTARVSGDDQIVAEFTIERSKIAPPENNTVLDESDDGGTISSPGMLTTTCKSTLSLKPGRPRVISGLKSQGPNKGTESVIVITAELISPEN